jgi:hypothetical protein
MQIKFIDILVHPDFYQMMVPDLSLHEKQLAVRKKWQQRFEQLKEQDDAVLIYFSILTINEITQRLGDPTSISNKIESEEIYRIKSLKEMLGSRFILFGWFYPPSFETILKTFTSRGISYIPQETKIHAYGEILEMCVWAWSNYIAVSLDIPRSNIEFNREKSLTNNDGKEISRWRFRGMIS